MELSNTLVSFLEYTSLASRVMDRAPCAGVRKTHYVYGGVYHGDKFCLNAAGAEVDCVLECARLAEEANAAWWALVIHRVLLLFLIELVFGVAIYLVYRTLKAYSVDNCKPGYASVTPPRPAPRLTPQQMREFFGPELSLSEGRTPPGRHPLTGIHEE